jgi:tetratricopeptide (TPR) repeat protein
MRSQMRPALGILSLVVSFGLSAMAQNWIDGQQKAPPVLEQALYFRSGDMLKKASIGFDGLLADLYWIRTIQYFGEKLEDQRRTKETLDINEMPLLEPLLKITTELDPHHVAAYRFGIFFLQYLDPEKAIRFAETGIRNNLDEWRLYQDLGFVYWQEGRYREAADAYSRGSRISGAPAWMQLMAASMLSQGGDRETAREMFRRLCEGNEDQFIKGICEEQLRAR